MIPIAFAATSPVIACKSSVHPMMTNKSGAANSAHSAFINAVVSLSASSIPRDFHALETATQNAMLASAPPPFTSNRFAANKINKTTDKIIDASDVALARFPGADNNPDLVANSAAPTPPSAPTTSCVGTFHAIALAPPPPDAATTPPHTPKPTMHRIPSNELAATTRSGTPASTPSPVRFIATAGGITTASDIPHIKNPSANAVAIGSSKNAAPSAVVASISSVPGIVASVATSRARRRAVAASSASPARANINPSANALASVDASRCTAPPIASRAPGTFRSSVPASVCAVSAGVGGHRSASAPLSRPSASACASANAAPRGAPAARVAADAHVDVASVSAPHASAYSATGRDARATRPRAASDPSPMPRFVSRRPRARAGRRGAARCAARVESTLRDASCRRATPRVGSSVRGGRRRARARAGKNYRDLGVGAHAIYDALTSRKSAARRNDGGVSRVMGSFRADAERARGEGSARARDEGAGALIILLELVVGVDVKVVVV